MNILRRPQNFAKSPLNWSTVRTDKSKVQILQNFVAFSQYMSFTILIFSTIAKAHFLRYAVLPNTIRKIGIIFSFFCPNVSLLETLFISLLRSLLTFFLFLIQFGLTEAHKIQWQMVQDLLLEPFHYYNFQALNFLNHAAN